MQIETDRSQSISDEGDEHDEHLDGAGPVSEIGTVVLERVQLSLQMFVALRHRLAQRSPVRFGDLNFCIFKIFIPVDSDRQ